MATRKKTGGGGSKKDGGSKKRGGYRKRQKREPEPPGFPTDPEFWRQMKLVSDFGLTAIQDGRVTDPRVIEHVEKSNDLVRSMPGRKDLKKRRRLWVPRSLEDGLPLDPPTLPPATDSCYWKLLVLLDELDYGMMRFSTPTAKFPDGVPLATHVTHAQFRGLTGWKSLLLDKKLMTEPSSLPARLPGAGVRFDPIDTARWLQQRVSAKPKTK